MFTVMIWSLNLGGAIISAGTTVQEGPECGLVAGLGGLSVWSLHILPAAVWVPSGYPRLQSKDTASFLHVNGLNELNYIYYPKSTFVLILDKICCFTSRNAELEKSYS